MKIRKYVWSAVPLVFVSLLVAAIGVGSGVSAPAFAQGVVSAVPCVPHPGVPGVDTVSWWPADTNAQDVIGGNDGILTNGATAGVASGMVGNAFSLNGTNQFVEIPNNAGLNPSTAITVDAWIFVTANTFFPGIVSKGNVGNFAESYDLFLFTGGTTNGQPAFLVNTNGTSTGRAIAVASSTVPLNTWTHVAGTYDGVNVRVYVNGVLAGTTPHTGTIFATSDPVLIGKSNRTPSSFPDSFFSGSIDEPEIYKTALSVGDISSIFAAGASGKCKTVRWDIINLDFLTSTVSSGGKAAAEASDNSEITVTGDGTFLLGSPDNVTSNNTTWKITKEVAPDVKVTLGMGTFEVQSLVRFVEAPGTFPATFIDTIPVATATNGPNARAGLAVLRIKYSDGSPGILVVSSHLTGTPDNVFQGITASKGSVDFFDREAPEVGENKNRTLFHVVVQ